MLQKVLCQFVNLLSICPKIIPLKKYEQSAHLTTTRLGFSLFCFFHILILPCSETYHTICNELMCRYLFHLFRRDDHANINHSRSFALLSYEVDSITWVEICLDQLRSEDVKLIGQSQMLLVCEISRHEWECVN